jgi:hypothetical protein
MYRNFSEEDDLKIEAITTSISSLCLALPIKKLVQEKNYTSDYILNVQTRTMELETRNQNQTRSEPSLSTPTRSFSELNSKDRLIALAQK